MQTKSGQRWHNHFLTLALVTARMSKDPRTQVGAVLVRSGEPVSSGYNGLPQGILDSADRLQDKTVKNGLILHAEENAIILAARRGVSVVGSWLYLAATDDTDEVWGGPPCKHCALCLIQAGITGVIARPMKAVTSWRESLEEARALLNEAGVFYHEVEL